MRKITLILISIIINCIFMSGCFSYRDINKILFVTGIIIDIDKENNPIVYCEAFKGKTGPAKGGGKEEKIIFKGTGKTCFEAIRNISLRSSYKLNYTQNKIIIFSAKAAEYGLDNFIDFFDRDQELIIRPLISVYDGNCDILMQTQLDEENYLGVYIVQLIKNVRTSSRAIELSLHKYLNQRLIGDKTNVVPVIELKTDMGNKLTISGGAIIKEDKMVGVIKKEEGQGFNFLMDSVKSGTLEPKNPQAKGKFTTLEILDSNTKTDIKYDENKIKLIKNIKVKTSLGEVQEKFIIRDNSLRALKMTTEANIKNACETIFNKYKEEGIDVFDIQEEFYRKYPKEKIDDAIKVTDLIVNVEVEILISGDTSDFF
ncbi:Ger(x)C family spore germination protein [Clostridium ganghwense]|uniref:Ger(X)C family spore germination protein n=1 Tax=Clostridium ganghwense TaxID=312089 RepID=A0ABT4CS09_9CLOT|nr:Ger(x)C family spore germination protein [Clostridium ganghwense]MCY6371854.1 Ger(x)C family spore germination protein [Clostridium ganghwense]